jgi:SAM-dependent methyltransferase
MPLGDLDSTLHIDEVNSIKLRLMRSLPVRIARAIYREITRGGIYGHQWGDPDTWTPLSYLRDHYVLPFVNPDHIAVDIGCGGGRWTYYLLGFKHVYAVDYYEDLLARFRKTFGRYRHVQPVKNSGTDFPGISPGSVDYILSFGCFGHINQTLIDGYLGNIKTILKPGGNVVIHYSDKNKPIALDPAFSDNTPEQMRALVLRHGFTILREDTGTMWNGSIIHFTATPK